MNNMDFDFIKKFIYEEAGIILESGKEYLVESRLMPIAKDAGFQNLEGFFHEFKIRPTEMIKHQIIDALTINETLFFRDIHPFETLKNEVLPEVIKRKQNEKTINIWCGASSSGQEPYSIAMILNDKLQTMPGWRVNFVASDISDKMLKRAKQAVYNQLEVNRGLPFNYLTSHFDKVGADWQLKSDIRGMVNFQKINLKNSWSLDVMDIIFMRNVLIYFDQNTKSDIYNRLKKTMHPDGILFIGGSESTIGVDAPFERIHNGKTTYYKIKK